MQIELRNHYMKYAFCQLTKLDELDSIQIDHPLFKASVLLQGAQIIEFSPAHYNFKNALWLSPSAHYKTGESIRGGVPICWPWFGAPEKNPTNISQNIKHPSAHGFARNSIWQLKNIKESCHQIEITLTLSSSAESLQYWPFNFELEAKFIIGKTLRICLSTHNTDKQVVTYSQALHTYLPTSDINKTLIHGADSTTYIDALDHWKQKQQQGSINFCMETDRIYMLRDNTALTTTTPQHTLLLSQFNSRSTVIWNPWIEKSKRISQFSPADFNSMFCIETANVLEDAVTLKPNETHQIGMQLSIEPRD